MNRQPKEEAAHIAANELLSNALGAVSMIIDKRDVDDLCSSKDEYSAYFILVAAHMQVAKLDSIETSLLGVLCDLRKEVDSLEARPRGGEVVTDHERKLIYQALMDDYMPRFRALGSIAMIAAGELDIDAAQRRFMRISGLE